MNKKSSLTCRAFATKEEKGESCFQPVGAYPVKKSCGTNSVLYKSVCFGAASFLSVEQTIAKVSQQRRQ